MRSERLAFSRMPSRWITRGGLKAFRWSAKTGADQVAALLVLLVIVHHTSDDGGVVLTYDRLQAITGVSRAKVAAGLSFLIKADLIRRGAGRSSFELRDYLVGGRGLGEAAQPCVVHRLRCPMALSALHPQEAGRTALPQAAPVHRGEEGQRHERFVGDL